MLRQFKHINEIFPKNQRIIDSSDHRMPHLTYPKENLENLKVQHFKPEKIADRWALMNVKFIKMMVNMLSGYKAKNISKMTQKKWLTRTLLFETMGVVPGVVGSTCRHMRSLRLFEKDKGWIQELIQESDNERFHFFTFLQMRKPGFVMRMGLASMQVFLASYLFLGYIMSSRFVHKFVGYLEEEAFKHYTEMIQQVDRKGSSIAHWKQTTTTQQAINYYKLDNKASIRDMLLMIRADQLGHNEYNHFFAEVDKNFDINAEKDRMYQGQNKDIVKDKIDQATIKSSTKSSKNQEQQAQS